MIEKFKPKSVGIPKSLGGGTMTVFRCLGRKPLAACSVPGCLATATATCGYALANGKECGHDLCDRHVRKVGKVEHCCPSHARFIETGNRR